MKRFLCYTGFMLLVSISSVAQLVDNIHFEQVGKQIHIFYDLEGEEKYTVKVYCSFENNLSWGDQLKKVSGDIGKEQVAGKNKMIVWDVLKERENLKGEIIFRIEAAVSSLSGTFIDERDGQEYKWVRIGEQVWMAENLNLKISNSYSYNSEFTNLTKFGRLYEWNVANTVCPVGWHLPSDSEWKQLGMVLGLSHDEANKKGWGGTDEGLKAKSSTGWRDLGNGTDDVGFMGLPGGFRHSKGQLKDFGECGYWWTSTKFGTSAWCYILCYKNDKLGRFTHGKKLGFSIRCLKD